MHSKSSTSSETFLLTTVATLVLGISLLTSIKNLLPHDLVLVGNNWEGTVTDFDPETLEVFKEINVVPDYDERVAKILSVYPDRQWSSEELNIVGVKLQRPDRLDVGHLVSDDLCRLPQVDGALCVEPELRGVPEVASKTERHRRTDRSTLTQEFVHRLA